jgi:hypothetical protein
LIVDHLKSQIQTTDEAQAFLQNLNSKGKTPKVEVYDVLSKYRKEDAEQFRQRQDPEFQAMEARSVGVSSNGMMMPQVSKVGLPIPGGAGIIGGGIDMPQNVENMFEVGEIATGDQGAAPMNFNRGQN